MFLQAIFTLMKGQLGTWLHINKQGQMYVWFLSDRAENRKREEKGGQIFVIIYLLRSSRKRHCFCAPKPHPFRYMRENVFSLNPHLHPYNQFEYLSQSNSLCLGGESFYLKDANSLPDYIFPRYLSLCKHSLEMLDLLHLE